jgi:hypothetical protein
VSGKFKISGNSTAFEETVSVLVKLKQYSGVPGGVGGVGGVGVGAIAVAQVAQSAYVGILATSK